MLELYVVDTETTGLDAVKQEPIEISIYRLSSGEQKTWFVKPINIDNIDPGSLRINHHKIEDLKGLTQEGRERYKLPVKVIVEIENWLMEDGLATDDRVLVGQNIGFDKLMLMRLWEKCDSSGTYPFNKKYELDTMQIEVFLDMCKELEPNVYSLNRLTKKYGIKNEQAHNAEADVKATVAVFKKQIAFFKKVLKLMPSSDLEITSDKEIND